MPCVLEMSTDPDITHTRLGSGWSGATQRHNWAAVQQGGLGIPAGETIIVIAHGHGTEIGNSNPGGVDVTAAGFLTLIQSNMAGGAAPRRVYISTCGTGIAEFTANVRLMAEQNGVWGMTDLYGHHDPQSGPVPGPNQMTWTKIF